MRRALVIAGALSVALLVALSWALAERDELRNDLASVNERLDDTYEELAGVRAAHRIALQELDDSTAQARRFRRRASAFAERASGNRLALERRGALEDALTRGQEVFEARLVQGDDHDLLVVDWNDPDGTRSGVYVWRVGDGSLELVYVVEPHVDFESAAAGHVLHGPPGAETEDRYDGWIQWVELTDVGDATGDGLPDVALQERSSGSGGCGKVRFLENLDGALRETFRRFGCDHGLGIRRGRLVYATAAHPEGCEQIHGCGRKGAWMRWTGMSWVTEKVTRDLY